MNTDKTDLLDEIERLRAARNAAMRVHVKDGAEIERLREVIRKDGEQHAHHIKELEAQWKIRLQAYAEEIEQLQQLVKSERSGK